MHLDLWDYFGREETHFITEFRLTNLDIWDHSRDGKTLFFSLINLIIFTDNMQCYRSKFILWRFRILA